MSNQSLPLNNFRRSEDFSVRKLKSSESFDLPNFLNTSSNTGNMAYFDDKIWYRSSSGWTALGVEGGAPAPSGNIVVDSISTNSGNLILNPVGPSVDFSGKTIANASDTGYIVLPGANWFGNLGVTWTRIDKSVTLNIVGQLEPTAVSSRFLSSVALPTSIRPLNDTYVSFTPPFGSGSLSRVNSYFRIYESGEVEIRKADNTDYGTGNPIDDVLFFNQPAFVVSYIAF